MDLGKMLELFLTTSRDEFSAFREGRGSSLSDVYTYGQLGSIVLRSQLDCHDTLLPRRTFDLKTRASLAIRKDIFHYRVPSIHQEHTWYKIHKKKGIYESFEREYFDMLRTVFLKYSLQARIGHMDGVFVAYHNTEEMFGFEYLPLELMEDNVFGNNIVPQQQFLLSLALVEKLVERVIAQAPKQHLEVVFTAPYKNSCFVYALPLGEGGSPLAWEVSVVSTTNGQWTTQPYLQTADDEWRLYYDIKEIPFVPQEYLRRRKRIDRLFQKKPQPKFSWELKQKLYPDH
jgi:hypothetical protein